MTKPKASTDDQPIVPPPATVIVELDRKPILYTSDGRPMVRKVGF